MSEVRNIRWPGTAEGLQERLRTLSVTLTSDSPWGNMFRLAIGKAMLDTFAEAFLVKAAGGTDRFGIAWLPLSSFTVEKKGKRDILVEGDDLYKSLKGSGQTILEAPASKIEVGSAVPYASFHQFGFEIVPGSPIRMGDQVLGFWDGEEKEVDARPILPTEDQLTEEWVEDVFRRAAPALTEAIVAALTEEAA